MTAFRALLHCPNVGFNMPEFGSEGRVGVHAGRVRATYDRKQTGADGVRLDRLGRERELDAVGARPSDDFGRPDQGRERGGNAVEG